MSISETMAVFGATQPPPTPKTTSPAAPQADPPPGTSPDAPSWDPGSSSSSSEVLSWDPGPIVGGDAFSLASWTAADWFRSVSSTTVLSSTQDQQREHGVGTPKWLTLTAAPGTPRGHLLIYEQVLAVMLDLPICKADPCSIGGACTGECTGDEHVPIIHENMPCPFHTAVLYLGILRSLFGIVPDDVFKDSIALFPNASGETIYEVSVGLTIWALARKLDVETVDECGQRRLVGHSTRVSGANWMAAVGLPIEKIQSLARFICEAHRVDLAAYCMRLRRSKLEGVGVPTSAPGTEWTSGHADATGPSTETPPDKRLPWRVRWRRDDFQSQAVEAELRRQVFIGLDLQSQGKSNKQQVLEAQLAALKARMSRAEREAAELHRCGV